MSSTPVITIGMRVRLCRGELKSLNGKERENFASWIGGQVFVGEEGIIALYTKSANELFSEKVRHCTFPDRICVLWDRFGCKPTGYTAANTLRASEGPNYQFCISGNSGDPLPDYLEVVEDAVAAEAGPQ